MTGEDGLQEGSIEDSAIDQLRDLGYEAISGSVLTGGATIVLRDRLDQALRSLNPELTEPALDTAIRALTAPPGSRAIVQNRAVHEMLVDGIPIESEMADGTVRGAIARVIDFDDAEANDWLVTGQPTVSEAGYRHRPDLVVFVNGLPLVVIELKSPAGAGATVEGAQRQLEIYQRELPSLFATNAFLVASDGARARVGPVGAGPERFKPWRPADADDHRPELQVLIDGMLTPERLLLLLQHFIVFEDGGRGEIVKQLAGYHQVEAVEAATRKTALAVQPATGNGRIGVVWHTQGSGKSLTMAFYAGRVILHRAMENPTIVMLTDRNDLDDQLFTAFSRCQQLLRQPPIQARSREHLREELRGGSGGVVFTTLQTFLSDTCGDRHPELSARRNIVVIAHEPRWSRHGSDDGFAKHLREALPNASFIAFTGTPVESSDAEMRSVFGEDISVYDVAQAVEDGATVPIFYERRWPKAGLELIARDIVEHFEARQEVLRGKGMVVCMSRRICVELYDKLVALRPAWHGEDDDTGAVKVVMTGSASDPVAWQPHIRGRGGMEAIATRFRDRDDELQLVLVRDMWLTGFDAPALHTMYIDKPMRDHELLQAVAQVNRVSVGKSGGLIVDYIGLATELREALSISTSSGGRGTAVLDMDRAVQQMLEDHRVCASMLHGLDWSAWEGGTPDSRLALLPAAQERILAEDDGKRRFARGVDAFSRAFSLAVPHETAFSVRGDLAFFKAVGAVLTTPASEGEVIDVFRAAGLKRPDVSVLSDAFLDEVGEMPQRNLAVDLLGKLLDAEIDQRRSTNPIRSKTLLDRLQETLRRHRTRTVETSQILVELIELAVEIRDADASAAQLGLTNEEVAFYDALCTSGSARAELGDDRLRAIAQELVVAVRASLTIDWAIRESVRAQLRVIVKRILRKHSYPPGQQEEATTAVLKQAEGMLGIWQG
jgi:type I restriction enzyme, R subunit